MLSQSRWDKENELISENWNDKQTAVLDRLFDPPEVGVDRFLQVKKKRIGLQVRYKLISSSLRTENQIDSQALTNFFGGNIPGIGLSFSGTYTSIIICGD